MPAGDYFAPVCPSPAPAGPFLAPYTVHRCVPLLRHRDAGAPATRRALPAEVEVLLQRSAAGLQPHRHPQAGCWVTTGQTGCDRKEQNTASRAPWDVDADDRAADLHDDRQQRQDGRGVAQAADAGRRTSSPPAANRKYYFPWHQPVVHGRSATRRTSRRRNRNDIDASIINLFAGHNRMHDFSYFLGFTEDN